MPEKAFWGIDEDANAFARFIARFITKYNRWNSPKFIFGESYGTTRSAVLANILENSKSIDLNGVILLSQIFNFQRRHRLGRSANPGVDLPYVLALPTYAATAWYHKKLPHAAGGAGAVPERGGGVHQRALYARAGAGHGPGAKRRSRRWPQKLHDYTGLPVAYLLKAEPAGERRGV